jgi:hypothetical protein
VARTRLWVPEFDELCDDCHRRNTPLEADNAAHATPPNVPGSAHFMAFAAKS